MRPVTKVILVLSVVALAVGVIWFATYKWSGTSVKPPAETTVAAKTDTPTTAADTPRSSYSDPITTYQRWRQQLMGRDSTQPPATGVATRRPTHDLTSSSETEGTVVARGSDTAVAGADPPGPTLRPTGVEGEVVTKSWLPHESAGGDTYTIASGDTLTALSIKFYGDPRYASAIEAANRGINPTALRIGERIIIPAKSEVVKPAARATVASGSTVVSPVTSVPPAAPATKVYVVQKNDTLIGIARRMYSGDASMYKKIYEANKDILSSPNAALQVGQRLRLPEP
jgi:nucleoid-associated protein YgaU